MATKTASNSQTSSKDENDDQIQPLSDCINKIKQLWRNRRDNNSIDQYAEFYTSCVAFMCHLKLDQETLFRASHSTPQGDAKKAERHTGFITPLPKEIPAITALLNDVVLFQTFLSMLTPSKSSEHIRSAVSPVGTKTNVTASKNGQQSQLAIHGTKKSKGQVVLANKQQSVSSGRKRTLSYDQENGTPKKIQKHLYSPKQNLNSDRGKATPLPNLPIPMLTSSSNDTYQLDNIGTPVLAATLFFTAFRHLDHWPPILFKAFATDSFGPRLWVDDERCNLFVRNLLTALEPDQMEININIEGDQHHIAEQFATNYQRILIAKPLLDKASLFKFEGIGSKSSFCSEEELSPQELVPSSDSDSGEEECVVEVSSGNALNQMKKKPLQINSSSTKKNSYVASESSSGDEEEMEEVVVSNAKASKSSQPRLKNRSNSSKKISTANNQCITKEDSHGYESGPPRSSDHLTTSNYWWHQKYFDLTPIRSRFVGPIKKSALKFVADALADRLEAKTKQNSGLLSTLPSFIIVPKVRSFAAKHLERWLQSPALSGLARGLFSSIVEAIENIDPPLPDDIEAIDSILSMKLKANQLTVHTENIKTIVKKVPTKSISRHIFLHLLREELNILNANDPQTTVISTQMRIFVDVHSSVPSQLAANSLASAVLSLLCTSHQQNEDELPLEKKHSRIKKVQVLTRNLATALGSKFDGYLFIKYILEDHKAMADISFVKSQAVGRINPDDIARLVFECATLIAPLPTSFFLSNHRQQQKFQRKIDDKQNGVLSQDQISELCPVLLRTRKSIIEWCLGTYARLKSNDAKEKEKTSFTRDKKDKQKVNRRKKEKHDLHMGPLVGAGAPDYKSVLDGETKASHYSDDSDYHNNFIKSIRCLLFLVKPESKELWSFLNEDENFENFNADYMSAEQTYRINICSDYGGDIDDEMMEIILKANDGKEKCLSSSTIISLMEEMFYHCRRGEKSQLKITDCNLLWSMYELAEFIPSISSTASNLSSTMNSDEEHGGKKRKREKLSDESDNESENSIEIPRLAYPGLWWRITNLILILSGMSPSIVGATMWKEHPTIRVLIKMITSGRYRFPTVDCDDTDQEKTKKEENSLREKESSITRFLFLPKSQQPSKKGRKDSLQPAIQSGHRTSARQRAKQERLNLIKREQEKARKFAEEQRIKKLLRTAQKTIMIWDPRCSARKPPKDSVTLLLSVAHLFGLSDLFRLSIDPDIVLQTIGSTSRGSIERAYDWLIPVISSHSRIINRLPPSASCFLLLRAYGTDRNQNSQLVELSSPLLVHVTNCLIGKFGEDGAQRAVDLLFVDLADSNPDRRRCARRVLQEATTKIDFGIRGNSSLHVDEFAWLFNLIKVKYAVTLLPIIISNISRALAYERGRVLCAYILALKHYIDFARDKDMDTSWNFSNILCELLSVRPHVCCAAMDRNPDLQTMAIDAVCKEVEACINDDSKMIEGKLELSVEIILYKKLHSDNHAKDSFKFETSKVIISLQLLRASLVLISNWRGSQNEAKDTLLSLVNYLIPSDINSSSETNNLAIGAASAYFVENEKRAVSVEQWVMLAKSRCHFIARNAALCTPDIFLPRLLLCCGLPRPSLMTMLERLGKLGDDVENQQKCFSQLLSPSATAEWGIGNIGRRGLITRKLLGRISAYVNIFGEKTTQTQTNDTTLKQVSSSPFVAWLLNECNAKEEKKKKRAKKVSSSNNSLKSQTCDLDRLKTSCEISSVLSHIFDSGSVVKCEPEMAYTPSNVNSSKFVQFDTTKESLSSIGDKPYLINSELLEEWISNSNFEQIESVLKRKAISILSDRQLSCVEDRSVTKGTDSVGVISKTLLRLYRNSSNPQELRTILLKWVPIFSQYSTDHSLFDDIFQLGGTPDHRNTMGIIVHQCIKIWTSETTLSCQLWVLTNAMKSQQLELYDLCLLLKFILLSSDQHPSQKKSQSKINKQRSFIVLLSQDNLKASVTLALKCAELYPDYGNYTSRNNLPDWLEMLLVIGNCGKKYLSLMTKIIVEKIQPVNLQRSTLPGLLLRLYVHFPSTMNLSDSKTRGILIQSANFFSNEWIHWRTSLDNQLDLSVQCLAENPNQRQQQLLSELAKRYPLLVVRELVLFIRTLKRDGSICNKSEIEKRGRINNLLNDKPIYAKTSFGIVRVSVTHWGYSFTEPLWISILEIMDSIPKEVLYACGIKMGLLDLLNLYMSLIVIQMEVGIVSFVSTLKSKVSQTLLIFHSSNKIEYDRWSASNLKELEGKGPISYLLKTYGMIEHSDLYDNVILSQS